jgi:hypothetical protein
VHGATRSKATLSWTLADCIARYRETQTQPINARTSALTPLGHGAAAGPSVKYAIGMS